MKKRCLLFLIIVLLFSCAPKEQVIKEHEFVPIEKDVLLDTLIHQEQKIKSLYGSGKATIKTQHKKTTIDLNLFYKNSNLLRADIKGIFGMSSAALVSNEDSLMVYSPYENKCYISRYTDKKVNPVFGLDFFFKDIVDVIVGDFGFEKMRDNLSSFKRASDKYKLLFKNEEQHKLLHVYPEMKAVYSQEIFTPDYSSLLSIEYGNYVEKAGVPIAKKVHIVNPSKGNWIKLELDEVELNPVLEDKLFEIDLDSDVEKLYLK